MGNTISSVTHTEGKIPSGAYVEAESAWEAAKDISQGNIGDAISDIASGANDPQGFVVGEINGGAGAGYRASWEGKLNEFQIESEVIAGASIGLDGPDASVRTEINATKDLGDGHAWKMRGFGQYSVRDGAEGQVSVERTYDNPTSDFGIQDWTVAAGGGTLGSSDNVCAAIRGEASYGSDTTRAFARGAAGICQDGTRYTVETGLEHDVGQYMPIVPKGKVFVEGGVRVGDGGQVGLAREQTFNTGGPTAFAGVKIGF